MWDPGPRPRTRVRFDTPAVPSGLRGGDALVGRDREAPVGLTSIELLCDLDTDAEEAKVARLLELTERDCVVAQTLADPPEVTSRHT